MKSEPSLRLHAKTERIPQDFRLRMPPITFCAAIYAQWCDSTRPQGGRMFPASVMHEVGIVETALALVERQAAEHHARRIERVVLRIGTLSGVDPDAVRFAFAALAPRSAAREARLEVEDVPPTVHCGTCAADFEPQDTFIFICPRCGVLCTDIRRGRELELARIEMA